MKLQKFLQLAINAHNGTSFSPERRGQQYIKDYSEQLENDLLELQQAADKYDHSEAIAGILTRYEERYKRHFSHWLSAKSRCISSMITGGSNFPVARAQKYNNWEDSAYKSFQEWRERCKRAIIRGFKPDITVDTELEKARQDLADRLKRHQEMKEGNKRIAKAKNNGEDITEYLTNTFGIKPHMIDWTMKFGFGLANNLAAIKRLEGRVKELEAKAQLKEAGEQREKTFGEVRVLQNFEADRVQLFFPGKPEADKITELKRNAFKWSPSNKAWQRKLTPQAVRVAEQIAQKAA